MRRIARRPVARPGHADAGAIEGIQAPEGSTPEHLLSLEVIQQIHRILRPGRLLVLNFVGYENGPHAEATWAGGRTLGISAQGTEGQPITDAQIPSRAFSSRQQKSTSPP
jgi:hypothetical protein